MKNILMLLVGSLVTVSALGGGISSGGGESYLNSDKAGAWFSSPTRKIDTCLIVSENFGVPAKQAQALFDQAVGTWQKYFKDKRVYNNHPGLGFSSEFTVSTTCNGDESLAIYLGVSTPEIEDEKAKMNLPLAIAKLQSYDTQTHWGKGLIWIAESNLYVDHGNPYPRWQEEERLAAIFLHELGHVFGTPHVEGTIMTERIVSLVREESVDYRMPLILQSIDHNRELKPCSACSWTIKSEIRAYSDTHGGLNPTGEVYKKLLGQIPDDLYRWNLSLNWVGETKEYVLTFHPASAPNKSVKFPVEIKSIRKINEAQVFKYQFGWEVNYGHIGYGFIRVNSNTVPVMIEYNLPQDSLMLTNPMGPRVQILSFTDSDLAEIAEFSAYDPVNLRE